MYIFKVLKDLFSSIFANNDYEINSIKYMKIKRQFRLRQINHIFYSTNYSDDFKDMIYELKYKQKKYVAKSFAQLIDYDIKYILKNYNIEEVIAVPISKKRLKQRGFNQVELILENLSINSLKIQKISDTKRMSQLKHKYEKYINIHNSFDVKNLNLDNKSVLIVDDIITTGSTINEIEQALNKKYKNIKIYVYAIAVAKNYENKRGKESYKNFSSK